MGAQQSHGPKRDRIWWQEGLKSLTLSWRLIRDPLVPAWTKLIPLGALAYVLLPVDLVPDLVPLLGQMDDLTVVLLGLHLFIRVCPQAVVERHRAGASTITVDYDIRDERDQQEEWRPLLSDGERGAGTTPERGTHADPEQTDQTAGRR